MFDVSIHAKPKVSHASAIAHAQVAAHPIVIEAIVIGAVTERHAARRRRCVGVQFVTVSGVAGDRIVVHVHVVIQHKWQFVAIRVDGRWRSLRLTNDNAPTESSTIVEDPIVGYFRIVVPAVQEDPSASLRAIGEGNTVYARRVAEEVGLVEPRRHVAVPASASSVVEWNAAGIVQGVAVRSVVVLQALGENGDRRTFVGSHERRFLQQLGNVSV